eukprot:364610_1
MAYSLLYNVGCPHLWLTLTADDESWHDLFRVLMPDLSDDEISKLSRDDRKDMLNKDPVAAARHFAWRVEQFLKILLDDEICLLGGVVGDYIAKIEFQMRGSPHLHVILWMRNKETGEWWPSAIDPQTSVETISIIKQLITR